MTVRSILFVAAVTIAATCSPAFALTYPFVEQFTSNAAGWTGPGTSVALAHSATGGVDNGGYVAHATASVPVAGSFMDPMQGGIAFRANMSVNASGGAFVGNWLTAGVDKVQAYVQHNYTTSPVEFYVRVTNGPAMVFFGDSAIPHGENWSLVTFAITPENATSAGGSFNGTLAGVQNFQVGARIPANIGTQSTPVVFKLDQVSLVPEPTSALLAFGATLGAFATPRRRVR